MRKTYEAAEREEHDGRESIAQDPLADTTEVEQNRAEEEVCANTSRGIAGSAARAAPAHEHDRSRRVGQEESTERTARAISMSVVDGRN